MLRLGIRTLVAWAPVLADENAWRAWAARPGPIAEEGAPDARFLPPLLRRRCTPLSRAMLHVAFLACPEPERANVRTVFASRHGENREAHPLFDQVVTGQPLSPTRFTHTVHNAQAGLYSIATGNRCASSAISGGTDTLGTAFHEALGHREREPERAVLVVLGEVPAADFVRDGTGERPASFAVGLLLAGAEAGEPVGYELLPPRSGAGGVASWPAALELVRWWYAGEPVLELDGPRSTHRFTRLASRGAEPVTRLAPRASAGTPGSC